MWTKRSLYPNLTDTLYFNVTMSQIRTDSHKTGTDVCELNALYIQTSQVRCTLTLLCLKYGQIRIKREKTEFGRLMWIKRSLNPNLTDTLYFNVTMSQIRTDSQCELKIYMYIYMIYYCTAVVFQTDWSAKAIKDNVLPYFCWILNYLFCLTFNCYDSVNPGVFLPFCLKKNKK